MERREFLGLAAMAGLGFAIPVRGSAATPRVLVSPIMLAQRRLVTLVAINGAEPAPFAIDTGGSVSFINTDYARALRLDDRGLARMRGVGGIADLPVYLAKNVIIGAGLRQEQVAFTGVSSFNGEIRGTLAAGVLTAMDSDLDIEKGEWRLYPDGRPSREGFVRMANGIVGIGLRQSARLYADATVNGRKLRFLVDTGAPSGLSLHLATARALGLWDDSRPYSPLRNYGIAGETGLARVVRTDMLEFGGRRFERPLVLLRQDGVNKSEDGVIGLELIRRFNLSTDVRRKELWVKPHPSGEGLSETYGMSGLWLDQKGSEIRIADVGTGSPAKAAGLKAGDRVVGTSFAALVRQLGGRPGDTVRLSVDRGGAAQAVSFVLAEYL
ncbi:hypothetical protein GCM10022281_10250 [Sphingomonas rosea]|uniref:PDZ domain-containing protein n=1 Tax=Sphingomonas rosea TaxID=335605 RepID=A0ABP7TWY6_9SPHN